jgi:hypothetical protein
MNEGQTVESETTPPVCAQCGSPLDSSIGGDETCSNCLLRSALGQEDDDPGTGGAPIEFGDYELLEELGRGS